MTTPNPASNPVPDRRAAVAPVAARSAGDLLEVVPYLLGFHPKESVVVIGLRERRVGPVARLDLADYAQAGPGELLRVLQVTECTEAVVAVYSGMVPDGDTLPGAVVVTELAVGAAAIGVEVVEAVLVHAGRYVSYTQPWECSVPLPGDGSVMRAEAVSRGFTVAPDRDACLAVFTTHPATVPGAVLARERASLPSEPMTPEDVERAAGLVVATARTLSGQTATPQLPEPLLVTVAVLLDLIPVRDAVWLAVDGGDVDGLALWQQLFTRLPAPWSAPALFLYGWAQWRTGNAVMAREACDRAITADGGYSAAQLLDCAITQMVNPAEMPRLREGVPSR